MSMFRERLAETRKAVGMSQQKLADAVNISRSTIAGYEADGKEPPYDTLLKISATLGVSTDYLLGAEVDPPDELVWASKRILEMRNTVKSSFWDAQVASERFIRVACEAISAAIVHGDIRTVNACISMLEDMRTLIHPGDDL